MKIAMVSEHASPLAMLGRVGAGGQSVHVAELSAELAEPPRGYTGVHVPAGPPEHLPKDELLRYMGPFARYLDARWAEDRPDVTHAHFWMSGIATQLAAPHLA